MIKAIAIAAILSTLSASACAGPYGRPGTTSVRVVCTVATPWAAEECAVEFGEPVTGLAVHMSSRADAEELVAILLANPGAVYVYDDGLSDAARAGGALKAMDRQDLTRALHRVR